MAPCAASVIELRVRVRESVQVGPDPSGGLTVPCAGPAVSCRAHTYPVIGLSPGTMARPAQCIARLPRPRSRVASMPNHRQIHCAKD